MTADLSIGRASVAAETEAGARLLDAIPTVLRDLQAAGPRTGARKQENVAAFYHSRILVPNASGPRMRGSDAIDFRVPFRCPKLLRRSSSFLTEKGFVQFARKEADCFRISLVFDIT